MRPFNLDEYLKDPSKKLVTRDGGEARIICTDRKSDRDNLYPIVALLKDEQGKEWAKFYTIEGKSLTEEDSTLDLFFAPEKKEGWINIYENITGQYEGGIVYDNEEDAKKHSHADCLATAKIEWEQ